MLSRIILLAFLVTFSATVYAQEESGELRRQIRDMQDEIDKLQAQLQSIQGAMQESGDAIAIKAESAAQRAERAEDKMGSTWMIFLTLECAFFAAIVAITAGTFFYTLGKANEAKKVIRELDEILTAKAEEVAKRVFEANISISDLRERADIHRHRDERKEELETTIQYLTKIVDSYGTDVYQEERAGTIINLILGFPQHPDRAKLLETAVEDFRLTLARNENTPGIRLRLARAIALRKRSKDKTEVREFLKRQFVLDPTRKDAVRKERTFTKYFSSQELDELTE